MHVRINNQGVLIITSGTTTEEYALKKWFTEVAVHQQDLARNEDFHYRGSKIKILPNPTPEIDRSLK